MNALGQRIAVWCGALAAVCAASGCIDTEPGLDVDVRSAAVQVEGSGDATVVGVALETRLHVGKYALAGRDAITIERIELFRGETPVALLNAARPEGFDEALEPGQTRTVTITGETEPGSFSDARPELCEGDPTIQVNLLWSARLSTDDPENPFTTEMGQSDTTTTDVTCL